jgi:transposase
MILLSHQGLSAAAIAGLLGCDPATVRRWIHRYNTHGSSGLADRPSASGPCAAGSARWQPGGVLA